jgi:hypothetical protein
MTNSEKSRLSGVRQTLLYTLYYRVLDQRSKAPIVGDTWAADVLDRIRADNSKGLWTAKLGASGRFPPLLRARRLDDWTREFLAHQPDATVMHLGCGLDSRLPARRTGDCPVVRPGLPRRHRAPPPPLPRTGRLPAAGLLGHRSRLAGRDPGRAPQPYDRRGRAALPHRSRRPAVVGTAHGTAAQWRADLRRRCRPDRPHVQAVQMAPRRSARDRGLDPPGSPSSTSSRWSRTSNGSPTADTAPTST